MENLLQIIRNLGPARIIALAGVFVATIGFLGYLMTRVSTPEMALLFSQVDPAEGGKISDKLDSLGIVYEIRGDGTQIYAPKDKVARLRMEIAQDGLPMGGNIGYEIFDRSDALGISSAMIDINKLRALEGELTKSIKSIQGVSQARVHLVLQKRELFSKEKSDPSASIMVKMKTGKLSAPQVQAIRHLVAAAVPGLSPEKVSIIDDRGALLAKQTDGENLIESLSNQQELKAGYENRIARMVESLLEKSLGSGKVRAEVNAEMDFDKVTINSVNYNPEEQVVKNSTSSEESGNTSESSADQSVSVQNALPNQGAGGSAKNSNQSKRNEESVSYEISNTSKTQVKESGGIKKLSVAVLVDGNYTQGEKGKPQTYQERDKKEIEQLTTLVKTAIGFNQERGDSVEVINMKFSLPPEEIPIEETMMTKLMEQYHLGRIIELLLTGIVGLLALLLVVKPMVLKIFEAGSNRPGRDAGSAAWAGGKQGSRNAIASSSQPLAISNNAGGNNQAALSQPEIENESSIDLANIEGRVKASTIRKIGEIIDKHPDEAVSIIRSWMYAQ